MCAFNTRIVFIPVQCFSTVFYTRIYEYPGLGGAITLVGSELWRERLKNFNTLILIFYNYRYELK